MVEVMLFGKPGAQVEQVKLQLERQLVKRNLDVRLLQSADPATFIQHDITQLPAIKVGRKPIMQVSDFETLDEFIQFAISQIKNEMKTAETPTILVPTDFSATAENAFRIALALAKQTRSMLKLLYVFYPISSSIDGMIYVDPQLEETNRQRYQQLVDRWQEKYRSDIDALIGFDQEIGIGQATSEIELLSKEPDISLIVMGTTGAGGSMKNLFGSVSVHVAKHAKCPVLLVPPAANWRRPAKMIYASSDPTIDEAKLSKVRNLLGGKDADIDVVHLYDKKTSYATEQVEVVTEHQDQHVKEVVIFKTDLVETLNDYALAEEVDLVIIEKKVRSFWSNLFHKSATRQMAIYSAAPLLVMHEDDKGA